MNAPNPDKAFILAAGKGTRLRPHTDRVPKPMVEVAGTSIIRRCLDKLAAAGVREVVVNLHHLAPVLEAHLKGISNPALTLSFEEDLLETGGGMKKALPYFGNDPFYAINGDALWDDGATTALDRLGAAWDGERMDLLLLLQPVGAVTGEAVGDYDLLENSRAVRAKDKTGAFMFAGIRIVHPRLFDGAPETPHSFLFEMDEAERRGRLYGIVHDGAWYHISTPEDLARTDAAFRERTT